MRHQKTCILALVTVLTAVSTSPSLFYSLPLSAQQTSDQAQDPRKAKADELFEQGQQQIEARQFDSARQLLQQALNLYQTLKLSNGETGALWMIGRSYKMQENENFPEAIKYYQQAIDKLPGVKNRQETKAWILIDLGNLYHDSGENAKALESYQESVDIFQAIGKLELVARPLRGLGSVYTTVGEYSKAIDALNQGLELAKRFNQRQGKAIALLRLGHAYAGQNNYQEAINFYTKSAILFNQIPDFEGFGAALNSAGLAYVAQNNFPKAMRLFEERLKIAKQMQDLRGEAHALSNIGGAYISDKFYNNKGTYFTGVNYLKQALEIFKRVPDTRKQSATLSTLGFAFSKEDNFDGARDAYLKAIDLQKLQRQNLPDSENISIFESQQSPYKNLQLVFISKGKIEEALEIAEQERAQALVDLLSKRFAPTKDSDSRASLTIEKIKQIAKAEKSFLVTYSLYGDDRVLIYVVQPTGKIKHQVLNLKSFLDKENASSLAEFVSRVRRKDIGLDLEDEKALANRTTGNSSIQGLSGLQKLHQLLIEPIAELLPKDPNAHVVFVPQDSLFLVPFPALQDASGKFLIEKHTMLTAPSIQVLDFTRKRRLQVPGNAKDILVVGNPTMPRLTFTQPKKFDCSSETIYSVKNPLTGQYLIPMACPLSGAETEARDIATKIFKTQPLLGDQANEAVVTQRMLKARIIHLATHGSFDSDRGFASRVLLAPSKTASNQGVASTSDKLVESSLFDPDGLLTAEEISKLNLNAELVVLSACNTGQGRLTGDGVIGLSRSFIAAGVPSVVVSLWSVPDAPTGFLMTKFYENLQRNPKDKAQALRQAMLSTMREQSSSPINWAAFTLIGEAE